MKKAIYPGTFDPITNGHLDVIRRGLEIFDEIIVAVAVNESKKPAFSIEKRCEFVQKACENLAVKVLPFENLLVDFAKEQGINVILRGLRAVSDFEYELQMHYANAALSHKIETIYLMPSLENAFISSSIVRSIASHGGDVGKLVPKEIIGEINELFCD